MSIQPTRYEVEYRKMLIQEIDAALESLPKLQQAEKKKMFFTIIPLLLGSDEARRKVVGKKFYLSTNSLKRYVLGTSGPHHMLYEGMFTKIKEVIEDEIATIEPEVMRIEEAEKQKRDAEAKEFQALVEEKINIVPDTSLNGRMSYKDNFEGDMYRVKFIFSYECRGVYDLCHRFPLFCSLTNRKHGHILLATEDGMTKLPNIIHTKADVLQALEDMQSRGLISGYFTPEEEEAWFTECRECIESDPFVATLPESDLTPVSYDLDGICWMM